MYPTKKQINRWLIEHKNKSNCNNWNLYNCQCKGYRKKYLCEIFQYGICYYYHQTFNHEKKCFIKKKYKQCNFIKYLKSPLKII